MLIQSNLKEVQVEKNQVMNS